MFMIIDSLKAKVRQHSGILKYIYAIVALVCSYMTLRQLSGQISESLRIICYVICLFSILKSDEVSDRIYKFFDVPWKKILLIMAEVYGTLALTGMFFLYSTVTYEVDYPWLIYFGMSFCWVRPIIQFVLSSLIRLENAATLSPHRAQLKTRIILTGIVLVPCILFLIAFNPAITSPDSESCFQMAHKMWHPDFSMQDWHPPFYVFILGLLVKIYDSVTFLVIVQCICFAVIFVDGILFLYQCGFSKKLLSIFYIFITFGISNIIQLVTLWKDIPYMISIMWLTLLLMKYVMLHKEYVNRWSWYMQFVTAVIFTAFFRQNGILPALAVVFILPVAMKFTKKTILYSLICLLLMVGVKGPLYRMMNAVSVPQLKFFSLANDIMLSYYADCYLPEEAKEMVLKILENVPDKDNFSYSPYNVDYSGSSILAEYSVPEFIKIYGKNVLQNPVMMMKAVASRTSIIWSIVRPNDEPAGCVQYLGENQTYSPNIYPFRTENILTYKLTDLSNWVKKNSVLYLFFWRTGIYNLLIILMLIIGLCKWKKKLLFYLLPFVPASANLAALAVSAGWPDYRYFWPSMTISLFLFFFFLYSRKDSGASDVQEYAVTEEGIHRGKVFVDFGLVCFCVGIFLYTFFNMNLSYEKGKMDQLKGQNGLESYLRTIMYQGRDAIIEIGDHNLVKILTDSADIANRAGINLEELSGKADFIVLRKGECVNILDNFYINGSSAETAAGQVSLFVGETGVYGIYLDGRELYVAEEGTKKEKTRIVVLDEKTKAIIDSATVIYEDSDSNNYTVLHTDL